MAALLALGVFCYLTVVHIFRIYIPAISKLILKKYKPNALAEDEKKVMLQALVDQQADINMKEEFAKYAKLDRRINKLKEELKSLRHSQVATKFTVSWAVTLGLNTLYTALMIGLIWRYRSEPMVLLPESWTWPVGRLLAFPCGIPGAVGITAWLAVCSAILVKGNSTLAWLSSKEKTELKAS